MRSNTNFDLTTIEMILISYTLLPFLHFLTEDDFAHFDPLYFHLIGLCSRDLGVTGCVIGKDYTGPSGHLSSGCCQLWSQHATVDTLNYKFLYSIA